MNTYDLFSVPRLKSEIKFRKIKKGYSLNDRLALQNLLKENDELIKSINFKKGRDRTTVRDVWSRQYPDTLILPTYERCIFSLAQLDINVTTQRQSEDPDLIIMKRISLVNYLFQALLLLLENDDDFSPQYYNFNVKAVGSRAKPIGSISKLDHAALLKRDANVLIKLLQRHIEAISVDEMIEKQYSPTPANQLSQRKSSGSDVEKDLKSLQKEVFQLQELIKKMDSPDTVTLSGRVRRFIKMVFTNRTVSSFLMFTVLPCASLCIYGVYGTPWPIQYAVTSLTPVGIPGCIVTLSAIKLLLSSNLVRSIVDLSLSVVLYLISLWMRGLFDFSFGDNVWKNDKSDNKGNDDNDKGGGGGGGGGGGDTKQSGGSGGTAKQSGGGGTAKQSGGGGDVKQPDRGNIGDELNVKQPDIGDELNVKQLDIGDLSDIVKELDENVDLESYKFNVNQSKNPTLLDMMLMQRYREEYIKARDTIDSIYTEKMSKAKTDMYNLITFSQTGSFLSQPGAGIDFSGYIMDKAREDHEKTIIGILEDYERELVGLNGQYGEFRNYIELNAPDLLKLKNVGFKTSLDFIMDSIKSPEVQERVANIVLTSAISLVPMYALPYIASNVDLLSLLPLIDITSIPENANVLYYSNNNEIIPLLNTQFTSVADVSHMLKMLGK